MIKKLLLLVLASLFVPLVYAHPILAQGKYSIKQMTPEVEAALESRKNRYEELSALKQKGIVGENNQGYVAVISSDPQAEALVAAENGDRKIIYQTIAEQNDLKDQINVIEKVFAEVQRDKAQAGEKIQSEDGQWVVK